MTMLLRSLTLLIFEHKIPVDLWAVGLDYSKGGTLKGETGRN